jgi:hypothetical protein
MKSTLYWSNSQWYLEMKNGLGQPVGLCIKTLLRGFELTIVCVYQTATSQLPFWKRVFSETFDFSFYKISSFKNSELNHKNDFNLPFDICIRRSMPIFCHFWHILTKIGKKWLLHIYVEQPHNVARLNVARLNVARLNVARLNVARLNVARLNVAFLNVARPNVAWLG